MSVNKNIILKFSLGIGILIIMLSFIGCSKKSQPLVQKELPKPVLNPYNLEVDGMSLIRDTIGTNETLSEILLPHKVSQQMINEIEKSSMNIFPIRKFRTDDELFIYFKPDSMNPVKYIVYVQDPINYVVFDLRNKIDIYKKQRPVTIKEMVASGLIKNSLFQTLAEKKIDERIAEKLADIYECEIDFFHIQQSDSFKVCYEQMYVEGNPVGSGKIKAACFNYHKENYYAFYYDKEKDGAYFDEKGNSLRRGFLKAPLKFSHITSRFSMNRFHPILHRNKAHLGTDFAAPIGTPIMTTGSGTVLEAGYTSGNGNYVKVKHSSTYATQYLHMSRFAKGIHRGVSVKQGQVIGYVGMTGLATGPHVCYRFWKNGMQVDPMKEKYITLNPISQKNKNDFDRVKEVWMNKLSPEYSFQQMAGANKTSNGSIPN
jgi:murein DD-endopeptidase MepM/ murein hydrolase activator NlpD